MKNEENKTNEQLHQEFEEALTTLEEKLYNLLHCGSYQLEDVSRSFTTSKVDYARMTVGEHTLCLRSGKGAIGRDGTEVSIYFKNNPVSEELLEAWDRQCIKNDIEYHEKKIKRLYELQRELEAKGKPSDGN